MSDQQQEYHIQISGKHKWFDLKLKEVWMYRDLILLFVQRSFIVKYKQTILGPLWILLNPVITSVMHTVIFGRIAGLSTEGVPKLLFYLTGNALWGYFAACLNNNSSTFVSNARLFGKVYFPRLTIPVSVVLSAMLQFVIQLCLVFGFAVYYMKTGNLTSHWIACLYLPFMLLQLGILGTGVGIIISSVTTKYRDLSILVGLGVQAWMYGTPVVYPLSQISDSLLKKCILLNPVTASMEYIRYAILGIGSVQIGYLLYSWGITILVSWIGILLFNKVERTFMDIV